jgi:hypothetical protein
MDPPKEIKFQSSTFNRKNLLYLSVFINLVNFDFIYVLFRFIVIYCFLAYIGIIFATFLTTLLLRPSLE